MVWTIMQIDEFGPRQITLSSYHTTGATSSKFELWHCRVTFEMHEAYVTYEFEGT